MCSRRSVAVSVIVASLAFAAVPPHSYARMNRIDVAVGKGAANDVGDVVAIGLGVTTGLLVLVGSAVWYYVHHRKARTTPVANVSPPETGTGSPPR